MGFTAVPNRLTTDPVVNTDWNTYVAANFTEVEARKETDYVEVTTATTTISATTAATANTIITGTTFTPDGASKYRFEFYCPDVTVGANASGNSIIFHLYENSTNLGRIGVLSTGGTTSLDSPVFVRREFTPTNASKTYSVRAHRTNANCTINAGAGGADVLFAATLTTTRLP